MIFLRVLLLVKMKGKQIEKSNEIKHDSPILLYRKVYYITFLPHPIM